MKVYENKKTKKHVEVEGQVIKVLYTIGEKAIPTWSTFVEEGERYDKDGKPVKVSLKDAFAKAIEKAEEMMNIAEPTVEEIEKQVEAEAKLAKKNEAIIAKLVKAL